MPDQPKLLSSLDWRIQPKYLTPAYISSIKRAPQQPLIPIPTSLTELTGPVYGHNTIQPLDNDLTRNAVVNGEPLGERILVTGRVLDDMNRPVPNTLVEIWQTNACGRYAHTGDQHSAPLDPNFHGAGRVLTDSSGN